MERLRAVVEGYYLPVFFGAFGVSALEAAGVANDQSLVANQLALLSLCSGNSSINQCEALLAQTALYLPAISKTLYDIRGPPSTVTTVKALTSKYGNAGNKPLAIFYVVFTLAIMVLGLWQVFMPTAGTEEESNGSLAEEDALITGQVPEGAASEARA